MLLHNNSHCYYYVTLKDNEKSLSPLLGAGLNLKGIFLHR